MDGDPEEVLDKDAQGLDAQAHRCPWWPFSGKRGALETKGKGEVCKLAKAAAQKLNRPSSRYQAGATVRQTNKKIFSIFRWESIDAA